MKEKFTTKIIVKETRVTSSGRTRKGSTYSLYQVIATKPSGEPINLNLRSFEDLPKDVVIEVDAELFRSEHNGNSYTLQRKGAPGGGSGPRLDSLEERVKRIEDFLSGRGEFGGTAAPPQQAAPQPPPPPPPAEPPPGDDTAF